MSDSVAPVRLCVCVCVCVCVFEPNCACLSVFLGPVPGPARVHMCMHKCICHVPLMTAHTA
jgi:hypothetical protein